MLKDAINAALPAIAETLTLSAKAISERRIKNAGFGVKYSENQLPAYWFHGKELNQRGTKFLEQRGVNPGTGKKQDPKKKRRKAGDKKPAELHLTTTTWGEFREAQGLQAGFVDLGYSNKMWANMQPLKVEERDGVTVALLGATNRESQDKMNWNFERYGDFIRKGIKEEDAKVLTEVVVNELENVLNQLR